MNIKKIDQMNFYELLNLERNASPEEIERAYLLGIAAYHPGSLASYGLFSGEERRVILRKLEEAYQTLRDKERKKEYDVALSQKEPVYEPRAQFRKSVQRLEIGSAREKKNPWTRLKGLLRRRKGTGRRGARGSNGAPAGGGEPALYKGEYLKGIRQNRGLSLEAVALATRLSVATLKALEEETYEPNSPGEGAASLLCQYAQALGLNPPEK